MKKIVIYRTILLVIVAFILTISCATTTVSTISNPDYETSRYKRILVYAPFTDIELRKFTENEFSSKLSEKGIVGIPSIEVVPPVKK